MAEIGIVASIIGVASAGFRLSLILNAICCEVAQAPLEIRQISKTVTLFSLMLKQTGTVLQAVNSVHSREAVEAAKQVADESNRVFDEINRMLDGVRNTNADGSSKTTAQQRIKWCFKRNRINYLLGQLESLKLSLSLMLQILQLGRLMASTSVHDPPEVVRDKSAAIQQERVEAQNTLIVRYMQIIETQQMYEICETTTSGPPSPIEYKDSRDNDSNDSMVTVKPPLNTGVTFNLVRLPLYSLGEVDQILQHMCDSSKDMVRSSDQAIDPLLDRWTRWREARENRHARNPHGRYAPTVQNLQEDDLPYYEIYREREDSPRGLYLEGSTTDWRKPNSVVARQELIRRKKQYAGYQPSVTGHSSEQEDSPASNASSKRSTKRHVINSSTDSSDSEEPSTRRPPSKFQPGPPLDRKMAAPPAVSSNKQTTSRTPPSPAPSTGTKPPTTPQQGQANGNKQAITPQGQPNSGRPYPTPDQTMFNHSMSMPVPPVYTHNAPNPYAPNSPHSPLYNYPPYHGQLGGPNTRQHPPNPNRMSAPLRPISRDGKGGKSPSRLSQEMLRDSDWDRERDRDWDRERERERERDRDYDRDRDRERDRDRGRDRDYARQERKSRESKNKALRDGATKGLLGAIGIAGFLEALEGLSI